jgi:L-asparagine oxygenase
VAHADTNGERILTLTPAEAVGVETLAQELGESYGPADSAALLDDLPILAARLPLRVWRFLRQFSRLEDRGYCVIRNNPVDDTRIGPTPPHWQGRSRPNREQAEEIVLMLYGGVLGEPFGWRTQQDGNLVHDVLPIAGHQHEQLGTGSRELITWHTEDAFHPYRGDYILLGALRNRDRAATTVAELDVSLLTEEDLDFLFGAHYFITPDNSHLAKFNTADDPASRQAFELIQRMREHPEPVPVLYGSRAAPYMCLDPYFMPGAASDPRAHQALENLISALEKNLCDVFLDPGDYLVINNHRAVHGRRPFTPRFDGTDRWLKRMNVTNDLRKSRALRRSPWSRTIG